MEQWYQNDFAAYDTYANLLYKIGRKNEAIDWEEKAVKLSNNDKTILDTLEKMKNNQKTWPEAVNNR
jgi:tetratricopeptide (TPR) repeat protein